MIKRFGFTCFLVLAGVAFMPTLHAQENAAKPDAGKSDSGQEAAGKEEPKQEEKKVDPSREIMELIQGNKLDEAAEKLEAWKADSIAAKIQLRQLLAGMLNRGRQTEKAQAQYDALFSEMKEGVKSGKLPGDQVAMPMQIMINNKMREGNIEAAAEWARNEINSIVESLDKSGSNAVVSAEGGLESVIADFRSAFNLSEETEKLDEQLKRLRHAWENEKDQGLRNALVTSWVGIGLSRINRKMNADTEAAVADVDAMVKDLSALGDPEKEPALFNQVLRARTGTISRLVRVNPKLAKTQMDSLKEMLDRCAEGEGVIKSLASNASRNLDRMAQSLEMELKRAELVGKPAMPLDAEVFVNGEALKDEDLKGKVVLLDFWAVWCGPCVATFPHLREWHEKYSEKGLVIIGVTKYYKYDWDDAAKQIKQDKELTPENEQKALERFAAHHELKHRFMVTPQSSKYSQEYAVTGIPQAVLIDREGKIRMIKVGSGEANAKALDEMIAELIGDAEGQK
ncbi:MAG: Thiol-disulfide oxidoreductase ResA [Planctomycetota bacterium]|jgi:thiol-disulfide isomerase/thioredoxin